MSFDSSRLSHAYITDDSFADILAMAVVCSARDSKRPCMHCVHCDKASRHIHPDITVIGRQDDKLIVSVDQIRQLKKDVYIVPNEAMQKAYVVNDADAMNANAQNALLQILEEPPAHAVFILNTGNPAALLPTVLSRCVELKPQSVSEQVTGSVPVTAKKSDKGPVKEFDNDHTELEGFINDFITALAGDNVMLMECMFRLDKFDKHTFYDFLGLARERLVLSLREDKGTINDKLRKSLVHTDDILLKAGEMLDLNVSTGHIAGYICASLIE